MKRRDYEHDVDNYSFRLLSVSEFAEINVLLADMNANAPVDATGRPCRWTANRWEVQDGRVFVEFYQNIPGYEDADRVHETKKSLATEMFDLLKKIQAHWELETSGDTVENRIALDEIIDKVRNAEAKGDE